MADNSGSPKQISLSVNPEISLADDPLRICIWGLPSQQVITLRAWLKDEKGGVFHSRAFYISDAHGVVDLEHSAAVGGDYKGIYPMGLFWALKPVNVYRRLMKKDVMGSPLYVHLEVYPYLEIGLSPENPPAVSKVLERWYVAPGVQRIQIREGRVRGALFLPPGDGPFPGVIDLFGSIGGLVEFRSSLLSSRGFAALALAYFAYEDLPSTTEHIDLTYFEEAAQLLINNPKVSGDGIGVVGVSKGAEIALAMASYLPQVKATVCINGNTSVNGITLRYRDLFIRGIPYHLEKLQVTDFGAIKLVDTVEYVAEPEHEDYIIPLEKARGSIIFMVGEDDQCCNSLRDAKESIARARKHGKKNVNVLSYPGAGHLLEPPGSPFCLLSYSPSFSIPLLWGGELLAHSTAQEMCWKELQEFFHKNLQSSTHSKL
ncbi:acyl-coenzyme A amino acid N-acyltransferase 2 [Bombina bombina]|uniref:acyl-coenzyme A amino acid N-acyltransferase 2 n=1 Tax=Bombina bombina TaxID=8345 RepID=UPI00235A8F05|nr:acyl-coenzyme A amino acid N-acyltransferase 2 [Bombina bombina]XP_053557083.1 acyl-coenzyme A amino acid N-acyltransferase 2 [Bombina bombina]